ncbi:MAG: IMPACT family protein, partial [Gammaproteobacteria bacterium]|nr:IMPACT family protein [Gammaproteobacteria bacterium]
TLASQCRYEELIRKSRFIAFASPVAGHKETLDFYTSVADPSATHNCWAWRIDGAYRSSDDGEPGGSAGRPILAAIEGRQLNRVMVVVIRHYGGIKLGVGGLIRAYGGTAARCLDGGEIIILRPRRQCLLQIDFALASAAYKLLETFESKRQEEQYDERGLEVRFTIPSEHVKPLQQALANISKGKARLTVRRLTGPA